MFIIGIGINLQEFNQEKMMQEKAKKINIRKKLTMKDALLIQCNLPKNLQEVEPNLLPHVTLTEIMTCKYENGLCCYDKSCGSNSTNISDNDDDDDDDDGDDDGDDNAKKICTKHVDKGDHFTIHPVDNLLTLIECADSILQQNIMSKLSLRQVALPFLLPNHVDGTVTMLLWAIRSIIKMWNFTSPKVDKMFIETPIVDYPSPVVSFLRIGCINLSKSDLLNQVIGEFDFFFFKRCHKVKCKKKITEGLVDLCYHLPGNKKFDLGDNPVFFLNLHGDARKCIKQVNFIQKLSAISFVFVNENKMNDEAIQIISNLAQNSQIIVYIKRKGKQKPTYFDNNNNVQLKWFKTVNMRNFQVTIQSIIYGIITSSKKVTLSECAEMARASEIIVDEDDEDCQNGYRCAKEILDNIKQCPPMEAKLKFFPLQGSDGWKSWAEIDRKQHQEFGKQTSDLEKYNAGKNSDKMKIRKKMLDFCNNLTKPVNSFLSALVNFNSTTKQYFLAWLELLLNEYNRTTCEKISSKLKSAVSIGLEHFFREMGQMYETIKCLEKGSEKSSDKVNYPRIMAELIADGHCMEIMDGDSTHVPVDWVSAVFNELQELYNHSTLYTVSIVGVQSTGKSTLLNTMFGLNFNVSAGRCTRGAYMQLLSFHKDSKNMSKCDHLLLIDTEGLRAPEKQSISKQCDNELATFVVGLADVAIINISGESQSDLSDIIQIVCHGLLRMKDIEINPSCKFIHQQITEPGAEAKTENGREKFIEVLDGSIRDACILEMCKGKYNSFSEFMKFNKKQDVLYFKPLWHGNPPMARVNTNYSEDAQNFKVSLINHADQHYKSYCSFAQFSIKINLLWNAVLREQFLFSFKNTLEVIVRKEYDQKHGEWNAQLRLDFLNWEYQTKGLFYKDKSQNAKERKKMLLDEIEKKLEKKRILILEERDVYFNESKYKTVLAQWKAKSNEKINDYYKEYIVWAEHSITQVLIEQSTETKVERVMHTIQQKLDLLADELLSCNLDTMLSDNFLEEKFNEKWSAWLDEIPSVEYKSPYDIEQDILQTVKKFLPDWNLINQKLLQTPLIKWNTVFTPNPAYHLQIKRSHKIDVTNKEIIKYAEDFATALLKDFAKHMESTETENVDNYQSILHAFDKKLNELIKDIQNMDFCQTFCFTKECILDIVLTASKQAMDLLIRLEEKAKANNPKNALEKKKKGYTKLLCMKYQQKKKLRQDQDAENERFKKERKENEQSAKKMEELVKKKMDEMQMLDKKLSDLEEEYSTQMTQMEQSIHSARERLQQEHESRVKEKQKQYELQKQDIEKEMEIAKKNNETKLKEFETEMKRRFDEERKISEEKHKAENERLDELKISHKTVIEYLLDIIENAVTEILRDSMKFEVYKDITMNNPTFKNKEKFKLKVLKVLLEDDKNFDQYKLFFTDPEESYKRWMGFFVNKHCDSYTTNGKTKIFHDLMDRKFKSLLKSIQAAITETNVDSNLKFSSWINEFSANMHRKSEGIPLSENDIQNISQVNIPWKSLDEVKSFKEMFTRKINPGLFRVDSRELYNDIENELNEYMWKTLKKSLLGCMACCPFCKEMCDAEGVCAENEKHNIKLHRPQCLGRVTWRDTNSIVVDICTTSVGSNLSFRNQDTNWEFIPFKEYQSVYPNWFINSTTKPTEQYWIWVVRHFNKAIADWCGGNTKSIPKEWSHTSKENAMECLNSLDT